MAPPSNEPGQLARLDGPDPHQLDRASETALALALTNALSFCAEFSAIKETSYVWNLTTDQITWEANALAVLGLDTFDQISTGRTFEAHISAEHKSRRLEVITGACPPDQRRGVPYRTHFRFHANGQRGAVSVQLEDQGRWWPGAGGQPETARGVLRVANTDYLEEQRLLFSSDHDELTGQLNRIRLTDALTAVLYRGTEQNENFGFLIVSINNLAVINDTFGYEAGDQLIAAVGRQIKSHLREGDNIGRYASNKFGVILQDCGPGAMRTAAERFMKAARDSTIETSAGPISISVSIGGVMIPVHAQTVQQALNCALRALDSAKNKRFDCFMLYEPDIASDTARMRSKSIAGNVVEAIEANRLRLVLQPLINAKTGRPDIYECLLRMETSDGRIVSAGEFIPVAEQLGLSRLIDQRTLELSVDLLKRYSELNLSINISGLTCSDQDWLISLQRLTGSQRDILSRIIIEITETAAIQDLDQSINFVDTLKDLGCRVAIDDFGAGYTSFRNLKMLNVDIVKIDGAFIKNLVDDASDQIFVKTMIDLAQSFGMETVAEWVGDASTVRHLQDAGITYMQGFYYGLPFDASDYGRHV